MKPSAISTGSPPYNQTSYLALNWPKGIKYCPSSEPQWHTITSFGINRSYFWYTIFTAPPFVLGLGLTTKRNSLAHLPSSGSWYLPSAKQELLQRRRVRYFITMLPHTGSVIVRSKIESLSFVYLRDIQVAPCVDIVLHQHLGTIWQICVERIDKCRQIIFRSYHISKHLGFTQLVQCRKISLPSGSLARAIPWFFGIAILP